MHLIAPDIVAEGVEGLGLAPVLCLVGGVIGFMLWLYGWRYHHFWVVLLATVLAGIFGMVRAPAYGSQPLLAGILLAIATGMLALALVRLVAFSFGGVAVCLLMQFLAPSWYDPFLWFLVGGLLALLLFRTWTMVLTSLAGTLLMVFSLFCLLNRWGKFQAVTWTEKHTALLNWICLGLTFAGVVGQYLLERRRAGQQSSGGDKGKEAKPAPPPMPAPAAASPWWLAWAGKLYRKAG